MDSVSVQTVTEPEQGRLITRPFVLVTSVALIFFVYVGMMVPIVPLFIEGPLDAGEFGIGGPGGGDPAFADRAREDAPAIAGFAVRAGCRGLHCDGCG